MRHFTIKSGATTFTRVSKARARQLWGKRDIAFCPVNLRPGFPWSPHITYFAQAVADDPRAEFDKGVNAFEWYNCSDRETGLYTAFYLIMHHV